MKTLLSICVLLTSLALTQAQTYSVTLTPGQDGGGARTGSGGGTLTLSGNTLTFSGFTFSGLSGNYSASHIHGPSGPFPASAGVLYDLGARVSLNPDNRSGSYSGSVTLAPIGSYTLAQQLSDLGNSQWYVNIHSATFGSGEIRGVITPVPEPGTFSLIAAALGGLGVWRWKRRRETVA